METESLLPQKKFINRKSYFLYWFSKFFFVPTLCMFLMYKKKSLQDLKMLMFFIFFFNISDPILIFHRNIIQKPAKVARLILIIHKTCLSDEISEKTTFQMLAALIHKGDLGERWRTLKYESRFTLALNAAKSIDYIEKFSKRKLRRIKFPIKNSVEAYLYLHQEWR